MFYCFVHNWYSTESMCPACNPITTATATTNAEGTSSEEIKEPERPPLGIMPEWRWRELRFDELDEAIKRYRTTFQSVPQKWIDEKYNHQTWLDHRKQQKLSPQQYTEKEKTEAEEKARQEGFDEAMTKVKKLFNETFKQ